MVTDEQWEELMNTLSEFMDILGAIHDKLEQKDSITWTYNAAQTLSPTTIYPGGVTYTKGP